MRGDPKAEGSRWLEQAREDLRWAELLAREGGFHVACFLAQQVAEKALKAYLYGAGEPIVPLNRKVAILAAEIRERERQLTGTQKGEWTRARREGLTSAPVRKIPAVAVVLREVSEGINTYVDNAPEWTERQRVAHLHSFQGLVGGAWKSKS